MVNAALAQFQQVFIEESLEGLDTMESSLLALDDGGDAELVHTIFRAAHSIKGGAATFGFPEMSSFTHEAESLLDEVRGGKRAIDGGIVELLLRTVDCLRGMFARARAGEPLNDAVAEGLRGELAAAMGRGAAAGGVQARREVDQADAWTIRFRPHPGMLAGGNDPLRLIRELAGLGELAVTAELDRLPALDRLDPAECHLGWTIELAGPAKRADIAAVFDWVEGECELAIEPKHVVAAAAAASAAPAAAPVADVAAARAQRETSAESSTVRVAIDKIDGLINLVGELVITQSMLDTFRDGVDASRLALLEQGLAQLARHTRELQESVMGIRMLPIASVFNRFPRMVRDISQKLGKQVRLELVGEHTELDKTVLEKIGDPLVHLVRNAIDHGLELPAQRRAAGKGDTGTLRLEASHRGGNIVVEVSDDGAGLNREAIVAKAVQRGLIASGEGLGDEAVADLIFQPGFSTAAVTTDLSGRGVGMDVVRRNVADLGGSVTIRSTSGKGSVFTITLPLTLAIIDGLTAAVGEERYIVPLVSIVESIQLQREAIRTVVGGGELFRFRGDYLPVIRLHELFGCPDAVRAIDEGLLIVVEGEGARVGLFVDGLIGQQQAVVKSLEANYRRVSGVSGATILADGSVALIVDVAGMVRMQSRRKVA
ncbi:chemotaxis protein CheA [Rhodanobacter sp. FW510-R12]|uniref:chemotaxis protein CheA n=1 Tax=unclassified Rhodanobacter TaxID=2621553 RepID=UPI0007A9F938|nr:MULTISPECIES: chemotaxis protein CheA [unclassified Rhodanobacter]KZC17896.1 chemotaxis protein CheA [Rhodanobacter sp. FW104-R8]KZC26341.1 chemotaxis protein CheA [Rhodanobacter sp. FW510-T8]KZC29859.1 chemotaxis protein CheA [Rhodanobacter sp. FW510-R10]